MRNFCGGIDHGLFTIWSRKGYGKVLEFFLSLWHKKTCCTFFFAIIFQVSVITYVSVTYSPFFIVVKILQSLNVPPKFVKMVGHVLAVVMDWMRSAIAYQGLLVIFVKQVSSFSRTVFSWWSGIRDISFLHLTQHIHEKRNFFHTQLPLPLPEIFHFKTQDAISLTFLS